MSGGASSAQRAISVFGGLDGEIAIKNARQISRPHWAASLLVGLAAERPQPMDGPRRLDGRR